MTKFIGGAVKNSVVAYQQLDTIAKNRGEIYGIEQIQCRNNRRVQKKRTRQIMAVGPVILAFIALFSVEGNPTGIFGLPPNIVLGIAFALVISVLIFSLFNWRCPACNKYLGKGISPKFCSKCGVQLS